MPESLSEQLASALGIGENPKEETGAASVVQDVPVEEKVEEKVEDAEDTEQKVGSEDEDDSINYLTELAETLSVDPSELYNIKVKTSEGKEYTIGDLKDMTRGGDEEINRRVQEFEAQKQQAMQSLAREREELLAKTRTEVALPSELQEIQTELTSLEMRYKSVDWEKFAEADPGKAALMGQQYQAARQELIEKFNVADKSFKESQQRQRQEFMYAAQQEFSRRVPEWQDPKIANEEGQQMTNLVLDYGITLEEISTITDPRMKHLLRDYAMLKKQQSGAEKTAVEAIKKGSGSLRRSAITGRFTRKDGGLGTLVAKAKQSGRKEDVFEAAKALLSSFGEI